MKLTITIPPSVNHLYGRRGNFTFISSKGKEWFESSMWLAKSQLNEWETLTGDVTVDIIMYTSVRRDVDNIGKATLDLLAKYLRLVENDNQVVELSIKKFKVAHKIDEKLIINLTPIKGQ